MLFVCFGVSTLIAVELFLRLPFFGCLRRILSNAAKAQAVLRSRTISDDWKEKALPAYSLRIGANSLLAFLFMLAASSPFFVLGAVVQDDVAGMLLRWDVLVALTALGVGYIWARRNALCRTTR